METHGSLEAFADRSPAAIVHLASLHVSGVLRVCVGAVADLVGLSLRRDFIEPSFESLAPCIKGEKSGYEEYRGESVFSFLPKNPSESEKFAVVMQNMNLMVGGPLVEDYDWQHFNGRKIVDVGGGIGAMPALLVEKYPHIAFVVQDLEEPVAQGEKVSPKRSHDSKQKTLTSAMGVPYPPASSGQPRSLKRSRSE